MTAPNIAHLRELHAKAAKARADHAECVPGRLAQRVAEDCIHTADAALIVAARNALPALLDGFVPPAELAALRSVAEAARKLTVAVALDRQVSDEFDDTDPIEVSDAEWDSLRARYEDAGASSVIQENALLAALSALDREVGR